MIIVSVHIVGMLMQTSMAAMVTVIGVIIVLKFAVAMPVVMFVLVRPRVWSMPPELE